MSAARLIQKNAQDRLTASPGPFELHMLNVVMPIRAATMVAVL
ncbi:hypothetical protein R2325_11525 [Mycobacteroides chelonae]|nr:hypothetical protein [Mycobacteroides chelonae]MEC4847142.1 hypothetical protein [Mycobacteroides chelonae]MEC4856270.1 hypothetical protein [Mycobacteroides chelonae]